MNAIAEREPSKKRAAAKFIGWTALGYGWRITASLLQIIFVWYIFSRLEDRFDTIVLAVSGLIYAFVLSIDLYFVHKQIEQEHRGPARKKKPHAFSLVLGVGFFVIGLICLYHLVNAR